MGIFGDLGKTGRQTLGCLQAKQACARLRLPETGTASPACAPRRAGAAVSRRKISPENALLHLTSMWIIVGWSIEINTIFLVKIIKFNIFLNHIDLFIYKLYYKIEILVTVFSQFIRLEGNPVNKNTFQKSFFSKKNIKRFIFYFFLLLVIGLIIRDLTLYPLQGNLYWMLGVEKDDITGVAINHYGQRIELGEGEDLDSLVSLFDVHLTRRSSDYIFHTNSGDWGISFLTQDGEQTNFFAFYATDPLGEPLSSAKVHIGHYYYSCNEVIYIDLLEACWEKFKD